MDPNTTILRVKRKRGTDPADALLLACKRIRPEPTQNSSEPVPEPNEAEVENSVFKLVATVATQDAPVQAQVRQTLARPRVAHAQRPSVSSSQRIAWDQRNTKWSIRRDERYRILSTRRKDLKSPAEQQGPQTDDPRSTRVSEKEQDKSWGPCEIQVVDLDHEDVEEHDKCSGKMPSDPDSILCNSTKMIREHLRISGEEEEQQQQQEDDDYVYDLYYQETATPGWIQDILYVRAYADEGELVPDPVVQENEVYDDEDDENEEDNWRNEYPDEESDSDSDGEERYGNYWQQEHPSRRPRSWESYQRAVLQELQQPNPEKDDDDDDDCDGDLYDSD